MNLVSSRPRVSKLEFFVALALVALAQSGKGEYHLSGLCDCRGMLTISFLCDLDVSIEQVAALSSQNTLPEPSLDLDKLQQTSSIVPPSAARKNSAPGVRPPLPAYSSDDPWNSNPNYRSATAPVNPGFGHIPEGLPNGSASTLGTGLPNEWWKKQETIKVVILGQQGFILNRYTVYEVTSDVRCVTF